jgi:hypothetical protein
MQSARTVIKPCGRIKEGQSLLLFLFRSGCGGLGGLGLGHALLEFIHASCRIHKFLLAGIERVAHVANADDDDRLRGSRLYHVAASATDLRVHVFRRIVLLDRYSAVCSAKAVQLFPYLLKGL